MFLRSVSAKVSFSSDNRIQLLLEDVELPRSAQNVLLFLDVDGVIKAQQLVRH
jgi:hypothetical protein